jgi:hypothetical protein
MDKGIGSVTIEEALPKLAKSKTAQEALRSSLGEEAVKMLLSGTLEGDLGDSICDFFDDEILNSSETAWTGKLAGSYPIGINKYEGVYYVWSVDYWNTGYFLSKKAAKDFISMNW